MLVFILVVGSASFKISLGLKFTALSSTKLLDRDKYTIQEELFNHVLNMKKLVSGGSI